MPAAIQSQSGFFSQFKAIPLPKKFKDMTYKMPVSRQMMIALMLNVLSLALPVMMLQVYDRIIPHQSYGSLIILLTGVLVALGFDVGLRIIRSYLVSWSASSHEHASSCAALDILTRSDLQAFEKTSSGEHLQNLMALGRLREFYNGQAWTSLIDLPFALIFLGLIAYLGGILVFAPALLLTAFFINAAMTSRKLRNTLESRSVSDDSKASFVVSVLTGVHTVKALSLESFLLRRFEAVQAKVSRDSYHVAGASGMAGISSAAFGQLSLIITATAGFFLVLNGSLSVGGLSACTLLAGRCIQPVQRVLGTWLRLQDLNISRHQAEKLFALPVNSRSDLKPSPPQGRVSIEDVSYTGAGENEFRLENINLTAAPGEIIALTGLDETAKSMLLQIVSGVLHADEGNVMIDDVNPADYALSDIRHLVGYLPQDGIIFKGTILENMTGFRTDAASVESAKEAGRDLGLDKVIDLLPRGYQTMLLDSAADPVPPGVKQRIALVRVLANRPAVLLFDDADRALDKDGYNLLFRMMGRLKGRTTVLLVTKDQNLLSFANRFFHLENGQLGPVLPSGTQNLAILSRLS